MPSRTKWAVAAAGLALSLSTGAGIASAQPGLSSVVNTTCSYPQVIAALNAHSPDDGAQFTSNPIAVNWLQSFLASPVDQRQQMIQQVQGVPGAQAYTGLVIQVANTCKNF
jgi:hemophore-related protein